MKEEIINRVIEAIANKNIKINKSDIDYIKDLVFEAYKIDRKSIEKCSDYELYNVTWPLLRNKFNEIDYPCFIGIDGNVLNISMFLVNNYNQLLRNKYKEYDIVILPEDPEKRKKAFSYIDIKELAFEKGYNLSRDFNSNPNISFSNKDAKNKR